MMEQHELPDYYEVLQVSRRADPLIITRAYRLLARLYHPDNKETGNEDQFCKVVDAYRTLADPVRRVAYEHARFGNGGTHTPGTNGTGTALSEPLLSTDQPAQDERQLRQMILQALYDVRRNRPYKPGLPLLVIAEVLESSIEAAQFTLWYLRGKKLIEITDDDGIAITVAGVDYLEANETEPAPEAPMPSLPRHVAQIPMRAGRRPAGPPPEER